MSNILSLVPAAPNLPAVRPLGDRAVRVCFAASAGAEASGRVQRFAAHLAALGIDGVEECVPGHATVAVFYNPLRIGYGKLSDLCRTAAGASAASPAASDVAPRTVALPVCYDGPDLPALAARHGLRADEAIALHSAPLYEVVMVGFLPGFPYLRGLLDRLHTPRLATPRARVPAGSVGIGGAQTGIYPCASPGGWHLIGRTAAVLFDVSHDPPSLLQAGDRVRFLPV